MAKCTFCGHSMDSFILAERGRCAACGADIETILNAEQGTVESQALALAGITAKALTMGAVAGELQSLVALMWDDLGHIENPDTSFRFKLSALTGAIGRVQQISKELRDIAT